MRVSPSKEFSSSFSRLATISFIGLLGSSAQAAVLCDYPLVNQRIDLKFKDIEGLSNVQYEPTMEKASVAVSCLIPSKTPEEKSFLYNNSMMQYAYQDDKDLSKKYAPIKEFVATYCRSVLGKPDSVGVDVLSAVGGSTWQYPVLSFVDRSGSKIGISIPTKITNMYWLSTVSFYWFYVQRFLFGGGKSLALEVEAECGSHPVGEWIDAPFGKIISSASRHKYTVNGGPFRSLFIYADQKVMFGPGVSKRDGITGDF